MPARRPPPACGALGGSLTAGPATMRKHGHMRLPASPAWELAHEVTVLPDSSLHLPCALWQEITTKKGKEATGSQKNSVH